MSTGVEYTLSQLAAHFVQGGEAPQHRNQATKLLRIIPWCWVLTSATLPAAPGCGGPALLVQEHCTAAQNTTLLWIG